MPSLNYKAEFAPKVESGEKRQTIRADRKYPIVVGDVLHHFTGMRTKACRKLGVSICRRERPIEITKGVVYVDEREVVGTALLHLAHADGFDSVAAFLAFFQDRDPFRGQIILW